MEQICLDDGTIVKWIQVANDNNAYQIALDAALANQTKIQQQLMIKWISS